MDEIKITEEEMALLKKLAETEQGCLALKKLLLSPSYNVRTNGLVLAEYICEGEGELNALCLLLLNKPRATPVKLKCPKQ